MVISKSGIAELDCAFTTKADPIDAIWYISKYEPENDFVEMIKITPNITA